MTGLLDDLEALVHHHRHHHHERIVATVALVLPAGNPEQADYVLACTRAGQPVPVPAGTTWVLADIVNFELFVAADLASATVKDGLTSAPGAATTLTVTVPMSADGSIPPDVTVLNLSNASAAPPAVFPDTVTVSETLGPVK